MTDYKVVDNENPTSDARLAEIFEAPGFGDYFTDHMSHIHFNINDGENPFLGVSTKNGTWSGHEVVPFANLSLSPGAAVLHYGQEIFEGMKAYKTDDGRILLFRPELNADRFNKSAHRVGLPDIPQADFLEAVKLAVLKDARFISGIPDQSLYIRPFMIASEGFIGVRAAKEADFYVIMSPVAGYHNIPKPVSIWIEREYYRSGPGGTGESKCGGNYAASLLPQQLAAKHGCVQCLYLNARDQESIEELGGMSFFAVFKDGHVETPELNGQILNSVTRRSVIEVLEDRGTEVIERKMSITELKQRAEAGEVAELFACGTAAVVGAIGHLYSNDGFEITPTYFEEEGPTTAWIHKEITGIQTGQIEDRHGWTVDITGKTGV